MADNTVSWAPTTAARALARGVGSTAALLLLLTSSAGTREHDAARAFLTSSFDLSAADFARAGAGQVISRTLPARDKREVATFGLVRVRITPEFYVEQLADIAGFKRAEAILQIGAFSDPPQLRDLANLTLDEADLRLLRECRVRDCGVQLSEEAIRRFMREVDWRHADAPRQANGLMREVLLEYVREYHKRGGAASMEYADRAVSVDLEREFVSLTESHIGGWKQFPALQRHLLDYPSVDSPQTTDLVYWSKEKVGRKTVASVTHMAIACTKDESPADYAIASKQIYGSHYFDASLGLTVLVRDRSATPAATYIAYLNRSRVDTFGGTFGGLARSIVSSRARATVSDQLGRLQQTLERRFGTRPVS